MTPNLMGQAKFDDATKSEPDDIEDRIQVLEENTSYGKLH